MAGTKYKLLRENNKKINETGQYCAGTKIFLIDKDSDVNTLPSDIETIAVGSRCLSIESGDIYVFTPSHAWVKFGGSSEVTKLNTELPELINGTRKSNGGGSGDITSGLTDDQIISAMIEVFGEETEEIVDFSNDTLMMLAMDLLGV